MSVVAIHPRTPAPAGPPRAGSTRRRSPAAEAAPVIRVTVDIPLVRGRAAPELSLLLGLVRDLLDRGADVTLDRSVEVALDRGVEVTLDWSAEMVPEGRPAGRSGADPARPGGTGAGGPGVAPVPAAPAATGSDNTGTLRVLTGPRLVFRDGLPIPLTRLEFDLLVFLAGNPRRVFTRAQLLNNVWGYQHAVARTVDVHVRRLRAKVGVQVPLLTTVHGVGYRLADDALVHIEDVG